MSIIFECNQQLIFMCTVPRFHRLVLFVIITHVGGGFFLFFFPPSDSRRFLLHSISTPNPTSPPKNYNRIQQFWVFVPFVKDKTEQEQFPSDQLIPIIFFLFLFCFVLNCINACQRGKKNIPTKGKHQQRALNPDTQLRFQHI
jgi:hypothetical protein